MMVNKNIQNRLDLSEWVIHFVHRRKSEDNLEDLKEVVELEGIQGDFRLPDYYDEKGKEHTIFSEYEENIYPIAPDAYAFDVLLKILHDGFIHSGWSLRNMTPGIYGLIPPKHHTTSVSF